jgi:hypothetical protein
VPALRHLPGGTGSPTSDGDQNLSPLDAANRSSPPAQRARLPRRLRVGSLTKPEAVHGRRFWREVLRTSPGGGSWIGRTSREAFRIKRHRSSGAGSRRRLSTSWPSA